MKNVPYLFIVAIFALALMMFVAGNAVGQTSVAAASAPNYPLSSDASIIASRIALLYHADEKVVASFVQAAINEEDVTGISAPVVVAIAIHESSFKSYLFLNSGNPFGIKASSPWTGPTFTMWHDDADTEFRVYSSADEAVLDFGKFVRSRSWYTDALACSNEDFSCILKGLEKTDTERGYSMNPEWGSDILDIIAKIGFQTSRSN